MEPVFKKISSTLTEDLKQALTYTSEKQRYLWYTDKISKNSVWENVCWYENDGILVYSETTLGLRMGKQLFPFIRKKKGFTFDKKTSKLKMWYRSQIHELTTAHFGTFLNDRGHEWVIKEGFLRADPYIRRDSNRNPSWLTAGLLGKILAGKITNPIQATEYIIKTNRLKGVSPNPLRQYIKNEGKKATFLYCQDAVTNLQDIIDITEQGKLKRGEGIPFDIIKQAKALGRKIDLNWSHRRLDEIHTQFTREIMKAEIDMIEDEVVDWGELQLPEGFELIKTKKRLFEEGTIMNHCVYTNYWGKVRNRDYMVLHVTDGVDHATAGIRIGGYGGYGITLDQIQAKHNRTPSKNLEDKVKNLLNSEEFLKQVKKALAKIPQGSFLKAKNDEPGWLF